MNQNSREFCVILRFTRESRIIFLERQTRLIVKQAEDLDVSIIGPATVGGIKAGNFRIGNTGGMLDNIVMSKLYRSGSVAYVSKSGGLFSVKISRESRFHARFT